MSAEGDTFSWIPFFEELADKLLPFKDRQAELIDFLEDLRRQGHTIYSLTDKDETGRTFLFEEMDPFTFLAVVHRGLTDDNRIRIAEKMQEFFAVSAAVPHDFTGIPVVNNQNSWFITWRYLRGSTDVPSLWRVFELAIGPNPLENPEFAKAFDAALSLRGVNFNLTMGLFWIRPRTFMSLDGKIREHLGIKPPRGGLSFATYLPILRQVTDKHPEGFPKLSYAAWVAASSPKPPVGPEGTKPTPPSEEAPINTEINYWMLGAWWSDRDPADQTTRFLSEGIWQNGFEDKLLDKVNEMKVGDRIAIKASTTQSSGLPFDSRGKTISKMLIKATGTVVKNRNDGRVVEVEWDEDVEERSWYFYTGRGTIWQLDKTSELARRLIRFAFYGDPQDYDYFLKQWEPYWDRRAKRPSTREDSPPSAPPYSVDDMIAEGVFIPTGALERMLRRLQSKKNLILQGAPGVGKTFLVRKLAYALMQECDDTRIQSIQFHPSFTYEDFVRGYRPAGDAGRFELVDGPLLKICQAAEADPGVEYVLLIDEVNRGNTSQIFGELLGLMEADKRGSAHAVTPLYRRAEDETFAVPENLYLIGTMNIADRSLALVDYALRRRFSFATLEPRYLDVAYQNWLTERRMPRALVGRIVDRMSELNEEIAKDSQLGPDFKIGHSFFCPRGDDFSTLDDSWFREIVDSEIVPLLREYWYDSPDKVDTAAQRLRAG